MAKSVKKQKDAPKKKKSNLLKKIFSLCLIAVACTFTYNAAQELLTTLQLKKDIADAQSVIDSLNNEHAELEDEKAKLEDPEYVKRYVRGKMMLSKEGEQVLILPSVDEGE